MIRRLRIKFVCINMAIVLLLLSGILGTVLHLDRANHDRESIRTMQSFAFAPPGARLPDAPPGVIHLPCFTLREGRGGRLIAAIFLTFLTKPSCGSCTPLLSVRKSHPASFRTTPCGISVQRPLGGCALSLPMLPASFPPGAACCAAAF